jgi:hypothetical protein
MYSGIKYEEGGDLPWSEEADDTKTYYATDLRKLALENSRIEGNLPRVGRGVHARGHEH